MDVSAPAVQRDAGPIDAIALSFVAGYVDTVGFIALFGLFTAHVTGNFVLLGAALIRPHEGLVAKLLALPVFIAAVAATTAFVRSRAPSPGTTARVIAAQMVLLAAFMVCALIALPIDHADTPLAVSAGLLGVAAMGVQNALARLVFGDLPPTTVMTGNVTQFAADITHLIAQRDAADRAATIARTKRLAVPVAAFAVAAVAGALAYTWLSFYALVLPLLVLAVVFARHGIRKAS